MKKILVITFLIIAFAKESKAQTYGVPDTLAYLQTIITNKAQYIGQPFAVLLNDLQIQVKFFFPFASLPYDKTKETSTSFAFYFPQTAEDIYLTYPHLEIYWQTPLNADQSRALRSQYRTVGWTSAIANFYANAVISDIKIRE